MKYVTLNNGLSMPRLGLGVYQVPDDGVADVVKVATEVGYRSIDTAMIYGNERGVGEAVTKGDIPREDLFITTKVWNADHGYENTLKAFDESLDKLGLDYIDLYLVHWPAPAFDNYIETYKALEKLYKDGRVQAIGVCNFHIEHLQRLLDECEVVPAVNQVECHPYLQQDELKAFCKSHNIYIESWSPLYQGGEVLENETIKKIAETYEKTPAQVILRWHIQEDSIVIPKSVTPSRIQENFDVFDFELTKEDMQAIAALNQNKRKGPNPDEMNRQ